MDVKTNVPEPMLTITLTGYEEIQAFYGIVNAPRTATTFSVDTIKQGNLRSKLNESIRSTGYIK